MICELTYDGLLCELAVPVWMFTKTVFSLPYSTECTTRGHRDVLWSHRVGSVRTFPPPLFEALFQRPKYVLNYIMMNWSWCTAITRVFSSHQWKYCENSLPSFCFMIQCFGLGEYRLLHTTQHATCHRA